MSAQANVAMPMTAPLDAEGDVTVRRFYWLRRLLVMAIVGGVVLAASWVTWQRRAQRRLDAEVARWHAAALPIEPGQFWRRAPPDEQNAAILLAQAWRHLHETSDLDQIRYQAIVTLLSAAEARSILTGPLAQDAEALRLFHEAAARPAAWWPPVHPSRRPGAWPWDTSAADEQLHGLWPTVRLHAHAALAVGDEAAFLRDMTDLHAVRRLIATEPTLAMHDVAWDIDRAVGDAVSENVRRLKLNDPQSRHLAQRLLAEMADQPEPAADIIIPFSLMAANVVERARTPDDLAAYGDLRESGRAKLLARVAKPAELRAAADALALWRANLVAMNEQGYAATMHFRVIRPPAWRALGAEPAESIFLSVWPGEIGMKQWVDLAYSMSLLERMATVSLACRAYAADHGRRLPRDLKLLVPDYLPALPRDPYDPNGSPLRYVGPVVAAQPFVYSVGPAGRDLVSIGRAGPNGNGTVNPRSANPSLVVGDRADSEIWDLPVPIRTSRSEASRSSPAGAGR